MAHGLLREDCRLHLTRDPGLRLTLASPNPAIPAPYRSPDALAFYHHREAADIWLNEITVRSLRASMSYIPEAWIRRVAPTPLMLLTAADDSAALGDPGNKIGEEGGNIETVAVPGGPFESFFGQFTNASMAATRWFRRHL